MAIVHFEIGVWETVQEHTETIKALQELTSDESVDKNLLVLKKDLNWDELDDETKNNLPIFDILETRMADKAERILSADKKFLEIRYSNEKKNEEVFNKYNLSRFIQKEVV